MMTWKQSLTRLLAWAGNIRRDSRIYSANCKRMAGKSVVIKVYDKTKISAVKHRSVKREARIMKYLTQKK